MRRDPAATPPPAHSFGLGETVVFCVPGYENPLERQLEQFLETTDGGSRL